jgi:hypothetical protein
MCHVREQKHHNESHVNESKDPHRTSTTQIKGEDTWNCTMPNGRGSGKNEWLHTWCSPLGVSKSVL